MNSGVPLSVGVIQGLIMVWPVLAFALSYRLLQFPDITVEGSFLIGAAVFGVAAKAGWSPIVASAAGMLAAGFLGAITGFLHAQMKINKFLAGILVSAAAYSIALRFMGASNIGLLSYQSFFEWIQPLNKALSSGSYDVAALVLLSAMTIVFGSVIYCWFHSRAGTKMRAASIGGTFAMNARIERLQWLMGGLALTNAFSGLGGALLSMRQGFADISMNQGVLILALAALSVGERIIPARKVAAVTFVLLSAIFGSMLYQVIVVYTIRAGVNTSDIKLITAVLVLAAIWLGRRDEPLLTSEE